MLSFSPYGLSILFSFQKDGNCSHQTGLPVQEHACRCGRARQSEDSESLKCLLEWNQKWALAQGIHFLSAPQRDMKAPLALPSLSHPQCHSFLRTLKAGKRWSSEKARQSKLLGPFKRARKVLYHALSKVLPAYWDQPLEACKSKARESRQREETGGRKPLQLPARSNRSWASLWLFSF